MPTSFYHFSGTEARPTNVHQISDVGVRKGVPLQSILDQKKKDWNSPCVMLNRETNQNLVPEQTDEMEKGEQDQGWTRLRRWRRNYSTLESTIETYWIWIPPREDIYVRFVETQDPFMQIQKWLSISQLIYSPICSYILWS